MRIKFFLMFVLSALFVILLCGVAAFADEYAVEGGNIYYNTSGTITNADSTITSADIPDSINGVQIISIGSSAFSGCSSLTSTTIPDNVTSIGNYAFSGCSSLTSITMSNSVTSIGYSAFSGCSSLASITIPESVTSIGQEAFSDCSSLISVVIPDNVTSIAYRAFSCCSSLTNVVISNNITSIGNSAFYGCNSLTSITIPYNTTSIGQEAFYNCSSLTSITIPNNVTSIGSEAFRNCSSLTSVTIPDNVTSIGSWAFLGCDNVEYLELGRVGLNYGWSSSSNLKTVVLLDDVTSIGNNAFYGCNSLTSITIPNSVTSIGSRAFYNTALKSVIIPESVTSIDSYAFLNCTGLTSVEIPNSVTSIENSTFSGCSSLTNITISDNTTTIGDYAFYNCSSLTSIAIPDNVTSIGKYAFSGCSSLTSVDLSDNVTEIGSYAFSGCSSLTKIVIPDSITKIYAYTFSDCTSLTSVTLPEGLEEIAGFSGCTALTKMTIPAGMKAINLDAFKDCSNLIKLVVLGSPTGISYSSSLTFNANITFYVVEGSSVQRYAEEHGYNYVLISESENDGVNYTVAGNLSLKISGDDEIIYDSDDETYNTDSFTLSVTVSNIMSLADIAAGNKRQNAKNVVVNVELPEGFSFSKTQTVTSQTLSVGEIANTGYASTKVYVINPPDGKSDISFTATSDNASGTTKNYTVNVDLYEFDADIYKADYLSSSEVSNIMENTYFYMTSPSKSILEEAQNNGLASASALWNTFTNTVDTVKDVSNAVDLAYEEKDMYSAIIMQLFEATADYSDSNYLSNETLKTSNKLLSTLASDMKDVYNYDLLSNSSVDLSSLSDEHKQELLKKIGEFFGEKYDTASIISKGTKYAGDLIDCVGDIQTFCETISSYMALINMDESYKQIMRDMYNKTDNDTLKEALSDCIDVIDAGEEEFAETVRNEFIGTAGKMSFKAAVDKLWSGISDVFYVKHPAAFVFKAAYSTSKLVSNVCFGTDEITEQYCKLNALSEVDELLDSVYTDIKKQYKSDQTAENAQLYNSAADLMFNMRDIDCDYALSYADAIDSSLAQKVLTAFGDSSVSSYKKTVESIQDSTYNYHQRVMVNWVCQLAEDDPDRYEDYKYLLEEAENTLMTKYNIACPVDIYVCDVDGMLVGSIVDDKIYIAENEGINLAVNNGIKTIYIYDDAEYTIVYEGSDEGTMDINITEYGSRNKETRNVYFNDISLYDGSIYSSDGNITNVTFETGTVINSDYDTNDETAETCSVSINNGILTKYGDTSADLGVGEKTEICAYIPEGEEFLGWTSTADENIFDDADSEKTYITVPNGNIVIKATTSADSLILGDANGDGELTAADAAFVLQYVLNKEFYSGSDTWIKTVDVNDDGEISAADSANILQKVLNNEFVFPAAK